MRFEQLKIFTGNANPMLAAKICAALGCPLGSAEVQPFSDGEIRLQILENVRGADVFAVQPTCTPVDRHLMELLLMIDALKRASAERITAVLPYYGYARQDRKDKPRMPISARLIANGTFNFFANARARSTPPASGETTVISRRPMESKYSIMTGEANR